jgi:hypothetical protein
MRELGDLDELRRLVGPLAEVDAQPQARTALMAA